MKLYSFKDMMPQGEDEQRILQQRSLTIAKIKNTQTENIHISRYIHFKLGCNEHYGIPYDHAKEVLHNIVPTKVPLANHSIAGVINYRGNLLTIIDLKQLFGIHIPNNDSDEHYIIIVMGMGMTAGIMVDSIEGSADYDQEILDLPLASSDIKQDFILGLHNSVTSIINIDKVLASFKSELK